MLKELYLSKNQLSNQCGLQLIDYMSSTKILRVFDISYNFLGGEDGNYISLLLANFFK